MVVVLLLCSYVASLKQHIYINAIIYVAVDQLSLSRLGIQVCVGHLSYILFSLTAINRVIFMAFILVLASHGEFSCL